ncbi:spinster family MFS transporter [Steroidobacter sp.]|uniref:spinster family MFS transporter n=1 Tax=Steroidobacter sp. TaxID=1978227 RepID=UPI001A36FA5A|nr:MFS transporter [Steroidobacter sp.]MBL8266372.1 MFS transporter [Steroidobacter sp.]
MAQAGRPWELYSARHRWGLLAILYLVSTSNYLDRNILAVLLEPIRVEFAASDTMLGLLSGLAFVIFYALFGIPVARWADVGNRRTIVTVALTVWSLMTVACGLAQTFVQLAIARVGVGAGESGAIPPAQSLIAEYFPPEQRASAIAIFTSASTAGLLLGIGVGGYVATHYGWRTAFMVAGLPGLVLAVLVRFGLREPRLVLGFPRSGAQGESLRAAIASLRAKPSFVLMLIGAILYFLMAYGALLFVPTFLVRVHGLSLAVVGFSYAGVSAAGSLLGTLAGGWVADRLARRDARWLAWLPALTFVLGGLLFMAAFMLDSYSAFLVCAFVGMALMNVGVPAMFAAVHAVCGGPRRAMAIAIVLFSGTLFGGGLGPLLTGIVSDAFSASHGAGGLRYSLILMTSTALLAGAVFYHAGRAMPADIEQ